MTTPLKRKAADLATSTAKKPKANASITSFFSSPAGPAKPAGAASTTVSTVSSSPDTAVDDGLQKSTASTTTTAIASSAAPPAIAAAPAPIFDKAKWIEKLTPEQKDLLALEIQSLHESWLAQLKDEVLSKDFLNLKRFLKQEHESGKKIFPPALDVYSWYVLQHYGVANLNLIQYPGHVTLLSQPSKLSFSVKIPITVPIKLTVSAFLSVHRLRPRLLSRTSISSSRKNMQTSLHRLIGVDFSLHGPTEVCCC